MHRYDSLNDAFMERAMKVVTVRNLPPDVARVIRQTAQDAGISVNKAVLRLLEVAVGRPGHKKSKVLHHDLDALAGRWSRREAAAFDRSLASQRKVDPEIWK
jgi:hypothetical protein